MRADTLVTTLLFLQSRGRVTAAEARTLFLVAGPSSAVTPEAKAALRKLVRALAADHYDAVSGSATTSSPSPCERRSTAGPRPPRRAGRGAVYAGVHPPRPTRD